MTLPETLQADRIEMPNIAYGMYRRTLADVKFQMAKQDTLDANQTPMIDMAEDTDLIKGIYEGGFKTWECSLDLVEFMHSMDDAAFANKKILELGCGSALPGIYLLMRIDTTRVDFQDYNDQVLQYITIPNIILNTVVAPTSADEVQVEDTAAEVDDTTEQEDEGYDDEEDDEDEDVPDQEPTDVDTADAELEISEGQAGPMLEKIVQRTQCYLGEWKTLPVSV
jgi:protein-histidine N-methyltransferase